MGPDPLAYMPLQALRQQLEVNVIAQVPPGSSSTLLGAGHASGGR